MKKLILTTIASTVFAAGAAFAQPQKGDWMIGASIANSQGYISNNGYSQFQASILPSAGYFVGNRLAVGTGVGLSYGAGPAKNHFIGYSISPFARYYFTKKQGIQMHRPIVFTEVGFRVGGYQAVDKINDFKTSGTRSSAGAGLGMAYFITQNVSVEGLLKLNTQNLNLNRPVGFQPSLNVGFNIYLKGRKKQADLIKEKD